MVSFVGHDQKLHFFGGFDTIWGFVLYLILPPTHNLSRIYEIRSIKKGVKLQFDRIFGKIYYAKIEYLRTFREFCSNPCGSVIRKIEIAAE